MGSNLHSNVRDLTTHRGLSSVGMYPQRVCFSCNKRRLQLGGKIEKRTRMWHCVDCAAKKGLK